MVEVDLNFKATSNLFIFICLHTFVVKLHWRVLVIFSKQYKN